MQRVFSKREAIIGFLLITLLCFKQKIEAQNLVPNGDFELFNDCPVNYSSGNNIAVSNWVVPTPSGSPDYFNVCAVLPQVGVPNNQFGSQAAHSGEGYIGLYNFGQSGYREYLQIELDATLEAGCTYYAEMYVSLSDSLASCGTDRLGMFLSATPPINQEPFYAGILLNNNDDVFQPQVENSANSILSNSTSWSKISGTFTAIGGERFLTIGNFNKNEDVNISSNCNAAWQGPFTTPEQPVSYYYIDDVSLNKACLTIDGNENVCPGTPTLLTATGSLLGDYHWFDTNNPTIELSVTDTLEVSPFESTTYAVADQYDTAYFNITVLTEAILDLGNDTTLCQGESLTLNAAFTGADYFWDNESTSSERIINDAGNYAVTVTTNGCEIIDEIMVEYSDETPLVLSLGEDLSLCFGEGFELEPHTVIGEGNYTWSDSTNEESILIENTGDMVWLTLENECFQVSDTINVNFQQCCQVYLPNAFSPNSDGINDEFKAFSNCEITITDFKMAIFDRWGGQIFEGMDFETSWDGSNRGKALPPDNYIYFVEYVLPGEVQKTILKGNITLVK